MTSFLLVLGLLWSAPSLAQSSPAQPGQGSTGQGGGTPQPGGQGPGGPGGLADTMLGISVVFPPDTTRVRMAAQRAEVQESVAFTNDGSIALDRPGDTEWWALLAPGPGDNMITISGVVDGNQVWHNEIISVPKGWVDSTYPVTLLAEATGRTWSFKRTVSAVMPSPSKPTGAGLSGQSETAGIPAPIFYLGFGAFVLVLTVTGILRSAILHARSDRG